MSIESAPSHESPAEPFFSDRGDVIHIHRGRMRPKLAGYYFFGWPIVLLVILAILTLAFAPDAPLRLIGAYVVVYIVLLSIYMANNTESAMTFELGPRAARLCYHDVEGVNVDEVPLDAEGTVVDVILNEATNSVEYGHLFGWTFAHGQTTIKVSAFDDWDVWDIQSLRDPVYKVIEHHRLERGMDLRYYQEGLRGVMPLRRRSLVEAPEPPTI